MNIASDASTTQIDKKQAYVLNKFSKLHPTKLDVTHVSLGTDNEMFNVKDCVVYKVGNGWLIFGEIQRSLSLHQIKELLNKYNSNPESKKSDNEHIEAETVAYTTDTKDVKESSEEIENFNEDDIKLIMDQTQCTRETAITALKENNMDVISAMLTLQKK